MKLIERHIEWLVAIAVVMITTISLFRALMGTLDYSIVKRCLLYSSILIVYLVFLYQKSHYGVRVYDKAFFVFYLVYCFYILLDITILRRYPLEDMLAVPTSMLLFIFDFFISIGYLLCAKTIVQHFNIRKYILLSLIVCTIPSILFIQIVGVELIQAGISEDDEEYIQTLTITYTNMPMLVLAVMNFKILFKKKWLSVLVCSGIIAAVLFILFAYGKRGPILWSFVCIVMCFIIKSVSLKKYIILFGAVVLSFLVFMDPIIDGIKEVLPLTGKKLELSLEEGDTSGRMDFEDPKHSTYLIGLDNFSRSPIWGYYFRLVTNYQHYRGVYAHNIFIEILMTMGLLGFIPFMILLFRAYIKSRRHFIRPYTASEMTCLIIFLSVFLQLQTSASCVFRHSLWLYFYILCCIDKLTAKSIKIKQTEKQCSFGKADNVLI